MAETRTLCREGAPAGTVVSTFVADVSDEAQLVAFRDHVAGAHATDHIELLFNNAGIGGGASFVAGSREEWDAVFGVCWGGVYHGTRTFLPMLLARRGRPRRQHQQRERLLGLPRPATPTPPTARPSSP